MVYNKIKGIEVKYGYFYFPPKMFLLLLAALNLLQVYILLK